jgi:hypothetical protein
MAYLTPSLKSAPSWYISWSNSSAAPVVGCTLTWPPSSMGLAKEAAGGCGKLVSPPLAGVLR